MKHLAKHMHDVVISCTAVWCDGNPRDYTEDPSEAECEACLTAAREYGNEAAQRLAALRYAKSKGVALP